ncbi:MAG: beta-galactosidase [Promethearchaeota archaeon]
MTFKVSFTPFPSFRINNRPQTISRLFRVLGLFFWLFGEGLILIQIFIAFFGKFSINGVFSSQFWNFDDNRENVIVVLVIVIFTALFCLSCIPTKPFQSTIIIIEAFFISATYYFGGGWVIGATMALVGLFLLSSIPSLNKIGPFKLKKNKYNIIRTSLLCTSVILSATLYFSFTAPLMAPYYFVKAPYEGYNQEPNENNILYILPIWEDWHSYTTDVDYFLDQLGTGSKYVKIGFSVSCWYMGELNGESENWTFNPFTSLYYKLNFSVNNSLPILFHMNGGNWGMFGLMKTDNSTIVSRLWQNDSEVQWDQYNRAAPPNDTEPPLKRRLFTLSKYSTVYQYRERNVKIAGTIIKNFADVHPDLFVGVSMDSEIHMNSANIMENYSSYYDYNPHVIREFREWLEQKYGDINVLNHKFGLSFQNFSEVDAPRNPNNRNSWWETWTTFRREMVKNNVEAEARWLTEVGISKNKIYAHQILSNPGNEDANYKRCDPIETANIENGNIGITRYGLISPSVFKNINKLSGFNWGIFEWNIWSETQNTYNNYIYMFKSMYQFGIRVICPYAWHEYTWPVLQISNNTAFKQAIKDFSQMVGDTPRAMNPSGFLSATELVYGYYQSNTQFFDEYTTLLLIPFITFLTLHVPIQKLIKRTKGRKTTIENTE